MGRPGGAAHAEQVHPAHPAATRADIGSDSGAGAGAGTATGTVADAAERPVTRDPAHGTVRDAASGATHDMAPAAGPPAPAESSVRGSTRGRALWTLIDQVLSSGTNSILTFIVARAVSDSEFGAFSVAFAVFAVVIGFSKAAGGQPLGIRYAGAAPAAFARASAAATGCAFVFGILVGAGCLLVGAVLGGSIGASLMALGVVLPGLLLQDLWRQVFFAQGRPAAAAANDAVWAVVQISAICILLYLDVTLAYPMLLAWGAAAAAAALFGVAQAGFWPSPRRALSWVREHRDINGYLAAEFITIQGALNASLLLIGAIGAIELVGALRGVQTLLGPTSIVAVGIISWAIPEFARRTDMTAAARMKAAYLLSAGVTGVGLVWGLAFLLLGKIDIGGRPLGGQLLGETWPQAYELLGLSVIQQAGSAATVGASCMLIALGKAKYTFRINAIVAPQLLLFPVVGVALADGVGAVCGFILAYWAPFPLYFRTLRRAVREVEQENAARRDGQGREPEQARGHR